MIQTLFGTVEQEPSLLERLKSGVQKTRAGLVNALEDALQGRKEIDGELLDELESTLISADIGVRTTEEILERIRQRVERHQLGDAAELRGLIREHLLEILEASQRAPARVMEPPAVVLVIGVNGSGKTTTIGKLTNRYKNEQRTVLLCAADTFRAAAIEQLEIWGQRTGTQVIRQSPGSDPSAVLFDALTAARARKVDYVIVDTAGRLQTKENLMAELQKMDRTAKKVIPKRPMKCCWYWTPPPARTAWSRRASSPRPWVSRYRADQTRRHRQGRNRGGDRARVESAHPLHRRGRKSG